MFHTPSKRSLERLDVIEQLLDEPLDGHLGEITHELHSVARIGIERVHTVTDHVNVKAAS
jgi:hypothetical protein